MLYVNAESNSYESSGLHTIFWEHRGRVIQRHSYLLVCYYRPAPRYLIYIIMATRQVSHLSTLHASTKLSKPTLRYDTNHTQLQLLVCFYIYLCFISMPDECFMNMMCIWQCVSERAVNETSRKFRNDNMQTKLPVSDLLWRQTSFFRWLYACLAWGLHRVLRVKAL